VLEFVGSPHVGKATELARASQKSSTSPPARQSNGRLDPFRRARILFFQAFCFFRRQQVARVLYFPEIRCDDDVVSLGKHHRREERTAEAPSLVGAQEVMVLSSYPSIQIMASLCYLHPSCSSLVRLSCCWRASRTLIHLTT
jgi:hypothetical protein